jgi:acyl CoA:acetate/3-ketoacid CoA transferase
LSKITYADRAAAAIGDDAVVTVSGASGLGCPDAMLRAIGQRFEREDTPRGLTTIHPLAAGSRSPSTPKAPLSMDGALFRPEPYLPPLG